MTKWARRLAALMIIAAVVHLAFVAALPRLVMHVVMARVRELAGENTIFHAPRLTAESRVVVMPSPDLLYSVCLFDVGARPLLVQADVPDTYWSVAMYADNTDAFLVVNDRDAGGRRVELILAGPDSNLPNAPDHPARVVRAPSNRGLILFRIFVSQAKAGDRLIAEQHAASCRPL